MPASLSNLDPQNSQTLSAVTPGGNWLNATTLTTKKPKQLAWLDVGRWGYEYRVYRI